MQMEDKTKGFSVYTEEKFSACARSAGFYSLPYSSLASPNEKVGERPLKATMSSHETLEVQRASENAP